MRFILKALVCLLLCLSWLNSAHAQMGGGISPPDPYIVSDNFTGISYKKTDGLSLRSQTTDPSKKTLVLLTDGQSLGANVTPTAFVPTNSTVVDQLNLYDGAIYSIAGPLLGTTLNTTIGSPGYGNIFVRVADTLVTNGKFDRVIIACANIGSTTAAMHATGGIHANRFSVAMARLAARGIVPGATGVTFAAVFDIGEDDLSLGTSQASMTASLNSVISNLQATGFNGRIFIPLESGLSQTSNNVRSAQAAVVTGNVKAGGDFDAITGRADGVHWNDTGAANAAAALVTAMAASGAPF